MDARLQPLEDLDRTLDALLTMLDSIDGVAVESLSTAWTRCERAFQRFRDVDAVLRGAGEPYPTGVNERVEQVVRKHAVAQSLATRRSADLAGELSRLDGARGRLGRMRGAPRPGGSCDVSG